MNPSWMILLFKNHQNAVSLLKILSYIHSSIWHVYSWYKISYPAVQNVHHLSISLGFKVKISISNVLLYWWHIPFLKTGVLAIITLPPTLAVSECVALMGLCFFSSFLKKQVFHRNCSLNKDKIHTHKEKNNKKPQRIIQLSNESFERSSPPDSRVRILFLSNSDFPPKWAQ